MKRIITMLLVLMLLFCACAEQKQPTQSTMEPSVETTVPVVEPELPNFGLYNPDSAIQILTQGAVKEFFLPAEEVYAISLLGEGMLLFSGDEQTTLTYVTEAADPVTATLSGCYLDPHGEAVRINGNTISYFDYEGNAVVTLDETLQETTRISLTTQIPTSPVLSQDCQKLYYFDDVSLRCLDLTTGISRLLKECSFPGQEAWKLHFDGNLLECFVFDENSGDTIFVSCETGETLGSFSETMQMYTAGENYFVEYWESSLCRYIFGTREGEKQCLLVEDADTVVCPLMNMDAAMSYLVDDSGTTLMYHDLKQGVISSETRLSGVGLPWSVIEDLDRGLIWFLASTVQDETITMYCWDPAVSTVENPTDCVSPYYTALEPDTNGLKELVQQTQALGDRFDLEIIIWEEAVEVMPSDYEFELEYLAEVYDKNLPILEKALEKYPKDFFKKLGTQSDNGVLTICLVRQIQGDNALGSLTQADGVHYWRDGSAYVALAMGDVFERTFYHEVFHAIDSYVITETTAYDNWEYLNPEGFQYDFSYVTNQYREDEQYLQEDTRSFIDIYSMSYPKEDRARVMEYAMMPDNASYFVSDTMQAKLKTLCTGIRQAFDLENDPTPLPWEQYLA